MLSSMAGSPCLFVVGMWPLILEVALYPSFFSVVVGTRDDGTRNDFIGSLHTDAYGQHERRAINVRFVQDPNKESQDGTQLKIQESQPLNTLGDGEAQWTAQDDQPLPIEESGNLNEDRPFIQKENLNEDYFTRSDVELTTQRNTRPSDSCIDCGPDQVEYSILVKGVSGIKLNQRSFSANLVLTLQWFDKRLIQYVEENAAPQQDFVTLDEAGAVIFVWTPKIIIANRAFGDKESIFWSMRIDKTGRVTLINQFMILVKNALDTNAFPFDRQRLQIVITPRTVPSDEVVLYPSNHTDRSGVRPEIFDRTDFRLLDWRVDSKTEPVWQSDVIRRSSGVLTLDVERKWWGLCMDTLWPDLLIVFASWAVLFFPPIPAFAMPRAGGSSVGFLTMITYHIRTLGLLPADDNDDLDWIEFWDECCIYLVVTVLGINILTEWTNYQWKKPELAHAVIRAGRYLLLYEATISLGVLALVALAFRSGVTEYPMNNIPMVAWFVRTVFLVSDIAFTLWVLDRGDVVDVDGTALEAIDKYVVDIQ